MTWGEVILQAYRKDRDDADFEVVTDKFLDAQDPEEMAAFQEWVELEWPTIAENPGAVEDWTRPTYLYVIEDIKVEFDQIRLYDPANGYDSIEKMQEGRRGVGSSDMKFGYFFDGTEALERGLAKEAQLKYIVLSKVSIPIIIVTICFMICGIYQIKDRSEKITRGIITLYETLEDIQNQKQGTAKTVLSFKKSALELNELHRTFNKVARTTMLT